MIYVYWYLSIGLVSWLILKAQDVDEHMMTVLLLWPVLAVAGLFGIR